jgi:hypothetical protein
MTLLLPQLFLSLNRAPLDSLRSANRLERIVEDPFGRMFDRLVKHVRQEGNDDQAQLYQR